ncbi:MAG: hypothetical protein AAFV78_18355 [Bacteroidota bacterium]
MKQLAKISYGINSITCVFIGILHTITHFRELKTEQIRRLLNHEIVVSGTEAHIWDLWQGMSLMMGYLLIIMGTTHLLILRRTSKSEYPPVSGSVLMILMLIGVIYTGYYYFGAWQVSGGTAGIMLQSVCLLVTLWDKRKKVTTQGLW